MAVDTKHMAHGSSRMSLSGEGQCHFLTDIASLESAGVLHFYSEKWHKHSILAQDECFLHLNMLHWGMPQANTGTGQDNHALLIENIFLDLLAK